MSKARSETKIIICAQLLFSSTSSFSWHPPIKVIFRGLKLLFQARSEAKIDHFRPKMTIFFQNFPKMNQHFPFFLVPADKTWFQQRKRALSRAESETIRHSKGPPPYQEMKYQFSYVEVALLPCEDTTQLQSELSVRSVVTYTGKIIKEGFRIVLTHL